MIVSSQGSGKLLSASDTIAGNDSQINDAIRTSREIFSMRQRRTSFVVLSAQIGIIVLFLGAWQLGLPL